MCISIFTHFIQVINKGYLQFKKFTHPFYNTYQVSFKLVCSIGRDFKNVQMLFDGKQQMNMDYNYICEINTCVSQ